MDRWIDRTVPNTLHELACVECGPGALRVRAPAPLARFRSAVHVAGGNSGLPLGARALVHAVLTAGRSHRHSGGTSGPLDPALPALWTDPTACSAKGRAHASRRLATDEVRDSLAPPTCYRFVDSPTARLL